MTAQVIGLFLSNLVILIAAVWRVSFMLGRIDTSLNHMNEKLSLHQAATALRLTSLEERVTYLERLFRTPEKSSR